MSYVAMVRSLGVTTGSVEEMIRFEGRTWISVTLPFAGPCFFPTTLCLGALPLCPLLDLPSSYSARLPLLIMARIYCAENRLSGSSYSSLLFLMSL